MPDDRPSTLPPDASHDEDREDRDERGLAKKLMERFIKRGLESGIGAFSKSEDAVRTVVDGLKVPKEMALLALDQVDETKNGLYRVVAKEFRDFLQSTNFSEDVQKALTGLAFEVKMEVRFKKAQNDEGETVVKPDVKTDVALKDREKKKTQFNALAHGTP